jgi:hypothetical protein
MKHLTSYHNSDRIAEVFIIDEQTYCVYCYIVKTQQTYVYVDTFAQAEERAKQFVDAL